MDLFVGITIEKISDTGFSNEKYKIKKLKTISGNVYLMNI